jgi:hypothetical protein
LSIVERDVLAAFFGADASRAFRWPHLGVVGLIVAGRFSSIDQGNGLHAAKLSVVEALYLGGTP